MKALKVIVAILLLLVAAFLIVALFLPSSAKTTFTMEMNAPAKVIFKQVNHLPSWEAWSPWAAADPEMQITYAEIVEGEGASYSWTSAKQGNGSMTITGSYPDTLILFDLNFVGQGNAGSFWRFQENEGGVTEVTWGLSLDSLAYPLSRYFGLFLGSMMQSSFEKGLNKLKEIAEAQKDASAGRTGEITEAVVSDQFILAIKDSCKMEEFSSFFEHGFAHLMELVSAQGLEVTAPLMGVWHTWNPEGYSVVEAAVPVKQLPAAKTPFEHNIQGRMLKGGKVVTAVHYGAPETSLMTYTALDAYVADKGLQQRDEVWEIYIKSMASEMDPDKWETQIVFPLK